MWDLAVREEDYAAAERFLARYRSAPPLSRRMLAAFGARDSAAVAALLEEARTAENRQLQIAARMVATYVGDIAAAEQLARHDVAWRTTPRTRADAQLLIAWLGIAQGRWTAARDAFAAAGAMEGAADVVIHRAMAATLPFVDVPAADLAAITEAVQQWQPEVAPTGAATLAAQLRPHLRVYLLGLLASRSGDVAGALRRADELTSAPAPPGGETVVRAFAATVRGDIALETGQPRQALASLSAVDGRVPLELVSRPAFALVREYGQEHARYLRAEALYALGDPEAERWWRYGFDNAPNEVAYAAPRDLRLAGIAAARGEAAAAATGYRRFIEAWSRCDEPLRPLLDGARAELARLTAR